MDDDNEPLPATAAAANDASRDEREREEFVPMTVRTLQKLPIYS